MKNTIILLTLGATALLSISCTPSEQGALIGGTIGAVAGSEIARNRSYRNQQYYNSYYQRPYSSYYQRDINNYGRRFYYNYNHRSCSRPYRYYY
jgi:hypothetical protein